VTVAAVLLGVALFTAAMVGMLRLPATRASSAIVAAPASSYDSLRDAFLAVGQSIQETARILADDLGPAVRRVAVAFSAVPPSAPG
jgi:hypothetical protein